jgi:hypothetical protein
MVLLTELPSDTLLHVVLFLRLSDVNSLIRTCKATSILPNMSGFGRTLYTTFNYEKQMKLLSNNLEAVAKGVAKHLQHYRNTSNENFIQKLKNIKYNESKRSLFNKIELVQKSKKSALVRLKKIRNIVSDFTARHFLDEDDQHMFMFEILYRRKPFFRPLFVSAIYEASNETLDETLLEIQTNQLKFEKEIAANEIVKHRWETIILEIINKKCPMLPKMAQILEALYPRSINFDFSRIYANDYMFPLVDAGFKAFEFILQRVTGNINWNIFHIALKITLKDKIIAQGDDEIFQYCLKLPSFNFENNISNNITVRKVFLLSPNPVERIMKLHDYGLRISNEHLVNLIMSRLHSTSSETVLDDLDKLATYIGEEKMSESMTPKVLQVMLLPLSNISPDRTTEMNERISSYLSKYSK